MDNSGTAHADDGRLSGPDSRPGASGIDAALYAAAVLAGAVLVFQVQPIAGKFLLPTFGGGASVWTTCMFFFQTMLLAGYAWAHGLTSALPVRLQPLLHGTLLLVSAAFLPLSFSVVAGDAASRAPGGLIWTALLASLGLPFLLLASTAPLVQRWSSITRPSRSPYHLYALSNAGALAALLSYPALVEPAFSLRGQTALWTAGYVLFLLASLAVCAVVLRHSRTAAGGAASASRTGKGAAEARWPVANAFLTVFLSACGVVMLLAVTNQVTQNVAPVPFLWVLPLVAFLATYIVTFSGERWYDRTTWGSLFVVAASVLVLLEFFATSFDIVPVVAAFLLVLVCVCMVCHGELYRLRPAPQNLGLYYLLLGFGGALGGAFVSVVAPLVFTRYWEGLTGAFLVYVALGLVVIRGGGDPGPRGLSPLEARLARWARPLFVAGWSAGLLLFPAIVAMLGSLSSRQDIASVRNFYGLLQVAEATAADPPRRVLVDGTTVHGFQLLEAGRALTPTSYYAANTGIGRLLARLEETGADARVGIIGLGAGTLAVYGNEGFRFRFYELNPAVQDLAERYFTFLDSAGSRVDVVIGDGRISLARELEEAGGHNYDVLVVDAFSSDAIPVHLLTLEAQRLYWSHLAPDGVLAFHVTNNYLDLAPVIATVAEALGKTATLVTNPRETEVSSIADWVMVTGMDDGPALASPAGLEITRVRPQARARPWTDDYSNLLQTLR